MPSTARVLIELKGRFWAPGERGVWHPSVVSTSPESERDRARLAFRADVERISRLSGGSLPPLDGRPFAGAPAIPARQYSLRRRSCPVGDGPSLGSASYPGSSFPCREILQGSRPDQLQRQLTQLVDGSARERATPEPSRGIYWKVTSWLEGNREELSGGMRRAGSAIPAEARCLSDLRWDGVVPDVGSDLRRRSR